MAESIAANGNILSGEKTVTTTGTAEALRGAVIVRALTIIAKAANTNQVYVGGSDVATTTNDGLDAGQALVLESDKGIDLSTVFLDVDTNGEGVDYYAIIG